MKKKFLFVIICTILMISELTIVTYADLIIDGTFHPYSGTEKLVAFYNHLNSPFKEIIVLLLCLFVIFGLTLLALKFIKNKENKEERETNNIMTILQRIFLGTNILLSILSIYLIGKLNVYGVSYATSWFDWIGCIILYLVYAISMIVSIRTARKNKQKRVIYITAVCLTIVILSICFIVFDNTKIGYMTFDSDYFLTIQ